MAEDGSLKLCERLEYLRPRAGRTLRPGAEPEITSKEVRMEVPFAEWGPVVEDALRRCGPWALERAPRGAAAHGRRLDSRLVPYL